ncbi:MAG TPA: DUF2231 domain-containing protein [Candidatus Krumholzibacteria bacterium]|nr:DUF2231 domain-containing protein [Candidatus Krumholzibacteria bacterium]
MTDRGRLLIAIAAAAGVQAAGAALASTGTPAVPPDGFIDAFGRWHPVLVHFPVALIVTAAVAELAGAARKDPVPMTAARFMVHAGAWTAVVAALAGFARADSITIGPEISHAFAIHRIAGIITPVIAFLAAGLADGVRRSGQIWELFLYRIVLLLAVAAACVAGFYGGELVFGAHFFSLW